MWKQVDPNKINSTVCMQCAACCKHTSIYIEKTERYARQKLEYLIAMLGKPKEDFKLETIRDSTNWRILVTWKCAQLLPNNGCKIYEKRPYTCDRFNCLETANNKKVAPENWEVIKNLVD